MTDALKRYNTPCGHGVYEHPKGLVYRKEEVDAYIADLSADLVRAGYLAGLEAAADDLEPVHDRRAWGPYALDCHNHAANIRALSDDPEAIAAIVARVTEGK